MVYTALDYIDLTHYRQLYIPAMFLILILIEEEAQVDLIRDKNTQCHGHITYIPWDSSLIA